MPEPLKKRSYWWLRVVFSTVGLLVCIFLIERWVRSYYFSEMKSIPGVQIGVTSHKGMIGLYVKQSSPFPAFRVKGIPYPGLILATATLAAVPWVRWSRQFSLRAFLIVSAAIAVLISTMIVLRKPGIGTPQNYSPISRQK
jgi:hypothetical protein